MCHSLTGSLSAVRRSQNKSAEISLYSGAVRWKIIWTLLSQNSLPMRASEDKWRGSGGTDDYKKAKKVGLKSVWVILFWSVEQLPESLWEEAAVKPKQKKPHRQLKLSVVMYHLIKHDADSRSIIFTLCFIADTLLQQRVLFSPAWLQVH